MLASVSREAYLVRQLATQLDNLLNAIYRLTIPQIYTQITAQKSGVGIDLKDLHQCQLCSPFLHKSKCQKSLICRLANFA